MNEPTVTPDAKARMVFDFYKQEREEFANLSRERTSLSLQLLVILGALTYAFFRIDSVVVRAGISALVVFLGLIGLFTNVSLEREMRVHVARARAARGSLGFLQAFVDTKVQDSQASNPIRQDRLYIALMIVLVLAGVFFALTLVLG
jgi:hypothetical protein